MIENEAMMYSILKKYGLYDKKEDYIDICYIGYIKGLKKYDSSKSKKTTYLYKCVENEILAYLRKCNANKRIKNELNLESIKIFDNGKEISLIDKIPNNINIEEEYILNDQIKKLYEEIFKLNIKEQYIIIKLYGLYCEPLSQDEIAYRLNYSQPQISRIKSNVLRKLRGKLK